jgi:hypothetical protein
VDRIATVALAKDAPRLVLLVGLRLAVGVVALGVGIRSVGEGSAGTALMVAGSLVTAYAIGLGIALAGLRVEVLPDQLHIVGPLVRWRFRLAPGPIVRHAPATWSMHTARVGAFGVRLGGAESVEGEQLTVVGLDPRRPVLVLPTISGRLGIGVRDEQLLVQAVTAATRGGRRG